jgi:hypothetical protein
MVDLKEFNNDLSLRPNEVLWAVSYLSKHRVNSFQRLFIANK